MILKHRMLFFVVALFVSTLSLSYAQSRENRFPHRIINPEDINKAGDDRFTRLALSHAGSIPEDRARMVQQASGHHLLRRR